MSIEADQYVTVTTRGEVSETVREAARQRVTTACENLTEPVIFAEVKLTHEPDPARERPYLAEAVITLSGATLRAHVAASDASAAVDLLGDRLVGRIRRRASRRTDRRKGASAHGRGEHEWRHGDLPTQRPEHFDRPLGEREVVRHKSFVVGDMTPDEAADTLELLGHDFLLFSNLNTGADAVLWFSGDGLELIDASGRTDAINDQTVAPIRVGANAVRHCSLDEAIQELDLDLEPFVFYQDPEIRRGQVLYRRYDGNYGLITPA